MRQAAFLCLLAATVLLAQEVGPVPRTWSGKDLADWATPIAALNTRPGHFPEAEYYRATVEDLRTYPVYVPGREPAGYWEMLQKVGPKPLVEPAGLKNEGDWVEAGKRVFEEYDIPGFRTVDPKVIEKARTTATYARFKPREDGTVHDLRWVPTSKGVALSLVNCAECHIRAMPDGSLLRGAPANEPPSPLLGDLAPWGASPIPLPGDSPVLAIWRSWAVPWIKDDVHEQIKTMPPQQLGQLFGTGGAPGLFPRWNGSAFYTTKIPDLIGFKDRKYIDHTATHKHRGPGDLMRYAALVTYSDSSDFGPHQMLTDSQRRIASRSADETLYALALYIYSLKPPANPNLSDNRIAAGQKIFQREGCVACHTPPLYTNNRLTLAAGFTPTREAMQGLDVMQISVGTDPNLALKTRKGTGFYKVPSLKGVWYRGRYLHDGALTKLEEMFDPARLTDSYVPSGFRPVGMTTRAVTGHEFGLKLSDEERNALIAFLRSL